jgi:hypothetical protein
VSQLASLTRHVARIAVLVSALSLGDLGTVVLYLLLRSGSFIIGRLKSNGKFQCRAKERANSTVSCSTNLSLTFIVLGVQQ